MAEVGQDRGNLLVDLGGRDDRGGLDVVFPSQLLYEVLVGLCR